MLHSPIYLDYAATTPVDPRVADKMMHCLTMDGLFANPASRSHIYGWQAEEAVEDARNQVAELIKADPREIVWTSGATEANNLAIKGVAAGYKDKGRHIISSAIEHKAVLDSCQWLETQGFELTYLQPNAQGLISPEQVEEAIRPDTILISLMHVNNELGVINPIQAIGEVARQHQVLFHVDAAQSVGKLDLDMGKMPVDLLSVSAHKMYGPKGVGALYVRRQPKILLEAQIHGGGHERGMRSGTLPTHQIVGFGEAAQIAIESMAEERQRIATLRQQLWQGISQLDGVVLNGDADQRVAGILNVSFADVDGETLLMALKDLAVSTGSACASADLEPSYVLTALGISREMAHSAIRFSLGRYTTAADIEVAIEKVRHAVETLRA